MSTTTVYAGSLLQALRATLEVEELRTCRIVRPKGSLGTCGFSPVPWEAFNVSRTLHSDRAMLRAYFEATWVTALLTATQHESGVSLLSWIQQPQDTLKGD